MEDGVSKDSGLVENPISLKFSDVRLELTIDAKKKIKKTVLHGISGSVNPGDMCAIIGPSGSGNCYLIFN